MNKEIVIYHFNSRNQDRIKFVRLLAECNDNIGLKMAKSLQDDMLNGSPIRYRVDSNRFDKLITGLKELDLKFELTQA